MSKLKLASMIVFIFSCVGCAQVGEINRQLADWAGEQIKTHKANKQQEYSDSITSRRDIDTLYNRIKREFNFQTIEEALDGCNPKLNRDCAWREIAIRDGGYVHEKTPGVYYNMGHAVSNPKNDRETFYVEVTLEKEGKKTLISYQTRGTKEFADKVRTRLLKAIK